MRVLSLSLALARRAMADYLRRPPFLSNVKWTCLPLPCAMGDLSAVALAKADRRIKLKGLILAQNERWRRG